MTPIGRFDEAARPRHGSPVMLAPALVKPAARAWGGGRGVAITPHRELQARIPKAGRPPGHPATAIAARAGSRRNMQEFLRPAARLGDCWLLGEHRLVCGDATDPATVVRALAGKVPQLMATDPPYGVNYEPEWRAKVIDAASGRGKTGRALGKVVNDHRADWREAWELFPGDIAYVWHSALNGGLVREGLEAAGFRIRSQIIWDKGRLIISRGHYHWRHEPCWYAVRRGRTARWAGDRKQTTVWPVLHRRSETGHATQKPVELMRRAILNHTRPGERVYDPFVGSGTTMIAAEETGRICHAIEFNPAYVDVTVRRLEAATGQSAKLESCCD